MTQKGFTHALLLIILILGLGAGLFLIQQRTSFFSKAGGGKDPSARIISITTTDSSIETDQADINQDIKIKFTKNIDTNAVNLWVDYCERWDRDGGCNFQTGSILVQIANLPPVEGEFELTFSKDHPIHKEGSRKVGIHPYYCNPENQNECKGGTVDYKEVQIVKNSVRPVLLIPEWLKNNVNEELLNRYKSDILEALKDVQQWYAQRLDGHTFQIDEKNFLVVYSGPDTIEVPEGSIFGSGYLAEYLDKANLLKETLSQDLVIWSIGDWSGIGVGYEDGYTITKDGRRINYGPHAYLTQVNLEQLPNRPNNLARNRALGMIAHEMGHSFGLVYAGWAKGHPCSVISLENCKEGAPTPLPPVEAWSKDVMGYEQPSFPDLGFNNSIHNPEVWKIYQSRFINPENNPPPPGTISP